MNSSREPINDYSNAQIVSHMLRKLKCHIMARHALKAEPWMINFYVNYIKIKSKNREDIKELLIFGGFI